MTNSIWLAVYVTQQHLFRQDAQGDTAIRGIYLLCAFLGAVLSIIVYFITKLWRK